MMLGEAEKALTMEQELRAKGILARAIRPPTGPPGGSRSRFNLSATHLEADGDQALTAIRSAM